MSTDANAEMPADQGAESSPGLSRGAVGELVFDHPERLNAFDADDLGDLLAALAVIQEADPDLESAPRALVVRGEGRAFCAGADLDFVRALTRADPGPRTAGLALAPRLVRRLISVRVPTVAAVQGAAYGGGACLALACDHVVASTDARFGFVFTALGLPGGDMSAPWLLARRVGARQAWRLLADAAQIDAAAALDLGLVDEVVEPEALLPRARAVATGWAEAPPFAIQATKRQVLRLEGAFDSLLAAAADEEATMAVAFARPEVAERVTPR